MYTSTYSFSKFFLSYAIIQVYEPLASQIYGVRDTTRFHHIPAHDHTGRGSPYEHDPLLYEDASEMTEYISKALRQAFHEAMVLLYSPEIDPFLEDLNNPANRVFYFEEGPRDTQGLRQDLAKDEGSEDAGGVFVIRFYIECLGYSLGHGKS